MSEHTEQLAEMYRNFAKSPVFRHLSEAASRHADSVRRSAGKSQDTAFGELRFADGVEWFLSHIKQQQVLDKKGAREQSNGR